MKLRDFSRAIGFSPSTVSRALNGYADVNEETRKQIVEAAKQYGYSPDRIGRRLRKNLSDTIGFVLSPPQRHFANPLTLDLIMGIDERLHGTPFQLIIAAARTVGDELATFRRLVEEQRVDGLIFTRTRRVDERILYLQERGVPFATLGQSESEKPFPFVDIDHFVVGREGTARFVALGHRRIAFINTPDEFTFSARRRRGYEAALAAARIPLDEDLIIEGDMTEEGGHQAALRLLALPEPPTAILCGQDFAAMGAARAVYEVGKLPGQDVGIMGGDDHPMGQYFDPPLTTFHAPIPKAGARLGEMLMAAMQGEPAENLQEIWNPKLVIRASDGPNRNAQSRREAQA